MHMSILQAANIYTKQIQKNSNSQIRNHKETKKKRKQQAKKMKNEKYKWKLKTEMGFDVNKLKDCWTNQYERKAFNCKEADEVNRRCQLTAATDSSLTAHTHIHTHTNTHATAYNLQRLQHATAIDKLHKKLNRKCYLSRISEWMNQKFSWMKIALSLCQHETLSRK